VGKRNRQTRLRAPESEYRDAEGNLLVLRGAMTPSTRRQYDAVRRDQARTTEDTWHRSVEFLFERLVVRWEVSGVATEGQKPLLMRFRVATQAERAWVRDVLREHLAEHFPEVQAP
jgi:hypothetical protein